jgi:2,4'-dihydroxyacetophenone dioxygenase
MTEEAAEEFLLPSPNPAHLPQSPLSPAFVNPDAEGLPWVEIGMDIMFKYLSISQSTGTYTLLTKYPPGTQIPTHRHSGTVFAYTVQGKWTYLEDAFVATAGCVICEMPNSNHTLKVFDDSEEDMILLTHQSGDLITFDEDGEIMAIDDAQTHLAQYLMFAKYQELDVDESLIARY